MSTGLNNFHFIFSHPFWSPKFRVSFDQSFQRLTDREVSIGFFNMIMEGYVRGRPGNRLSCRDGNSWFDIIAVLMP